MFGLSFGEIVIIAVLALLLLGPDRLPDAAKTLGKTMRDLRRATEDLKDQVEKEIYAEEKKPAIGKPSLVPPVPAAGAPVPGPSGPPPAASSENVPGLEAALAEAAPEGAAASQPDAFLVPPSAPVAAPAAEPPGATSDAEKVP